MVVYFMKSVMCSYSIFYKLTTCYKREIATDWFYTNHKGVQNYHILANLTMFVWELSCLGGLL